MSLYGGIKFASSSGSAPPEEGKPSTSTSQPSSSTFTSGQGQPPTSTPQPQKTGEWSAALKFAPRVNKPKPLTASRPIGFASTTTTIASSSSSGTSPIVTKSKPDIIRSAEPSLTGVGISTGGQNVEDEIQFGADGLPLAKAPAMTLVPKGAGTGKREREGEDKKRKKKKKKRNNFGQPFVSTFNPDEQYDPNRPNDLGEYQAYRKRMREERRMKLVEERRRKAEGLSSGESSYYTDSEEEAPRRDAPKMFAPPKIYSENTSTPNHPPPPSLTTPQASSGDDAYARRAAMASSGDDAYARRAALSHPTSSSTGDDAYARRAAMSQQPASGDDAYARRVAMSQGQQPPSFAPSSSSAQAPQFAPPAQNAASSDIPGFASSVPAPVPAATSAAEASDKEKEDFAKMLEDRKKAAEAIAAKFRAFGGGAAAGPSDPPPVTASAPVEDSGNGTFAEKMMRKWGHQEGSTLGIRNEGLVHALTAEHVINQPQPKPGETLSKRQIAKQKTAMANLKNKKWVQAPTSRGRIVNANEDARALDERGKRGEESRIICLVGVVGSEEEIDEELGDEIGEECSKYGIVERVVLHMVEPPPPEPSECLRIFVVFSGMAGAWRATKELDGRFFGGRKIRATYFDEERFDRGERDGEILG
ncbi:hypothetical protein I302_105832 [Kwoniella bestiolae CBS 10118]|uniref:RNA recognition motif domain-containing protein n=1 Tax=Kwoniella bestiolae CBS 10118 TaxID=1296100 RepID=A0A1B9G298_9TREE|nr:hypothetical protein I302_04954 [Kwoniella bestiolae CBS 10118]OCF25144.1 hypothetical protein I302_04954 [Kwoniella bestiolae CBS 10118]